ncbi:MAG TPA: anti-Sigm factor, ChrR [Alcaligenes faecalis]|nr:anti-Sigm factor, ChrR [Alcaligenes faecalis]
MNDQAQATATEANEGKHYAQRLKGQLEPTQGGSVYVDPESMEWQPSQFDKISMKVLYRNDAEGEMTVLLKWEPGAVLPFHRHPEIEQSYVLQGSFYDHDGICRAGQYVWRHPGSLHETHSDEGCILLAVYRKPNVFFGTAGFQAT